MRRWTATDQARHRELLVAALRSGDYEQVQDKLFSQVTEGEQLVPRLGYCCLGVGCVVAKNNGLPELDIQIRQADFTGFVRWENEDELTVEDCDTELPGSVQEYYGFATDAGHLKQLWDCHTEQWIDPDQPYPREHKICDSLVRLNDEAGFTFAQIADVIEQGLVRTL